ncbi:diacylglycerol/lipid kinase family protein [Rubrivirga sp.]|uniref:diacylglycerol/lipid kinase family protein n=1 Tax=Rubrivirga sp. TaxID=1885344 RepID=UPI003B5246E0
MTAHVLLNPAARGGRNARLRSVLASHLAEAGVEAEVVETTGPGDAERLARCYGEAGGLVVVAGGDGTVHEAVNGLCGTDGTLAVLPLGTGNDYVGALGMSPDLATACRQLTGARHRADVGHVCWTDTAGGTHERRFANALGIGFDAHAAALASETKWIGGRAAYLVAVVRTLWAWRRPSLRVRVTTSGGSGLAHDGSLFLCEVGNGPSIGGGFRMTPDAVLDDGVLDVCLVRHVRPGRALRLLPRTFDGGHVTEPEVTMGRATTLVLAVQAGGGVGLQADGEVLAYDAAEVRVEVRPAALRVVAPGLATPA